MPGSPARSPWRSPRWLTQLVCDETDACEAMGYFARGQNTELGWSDPTVRQNRCPIPLGFGGRSSLLLLAGAVRVLAARIRRCKQH